MFILPGSVMAAQGHCFMVGEFFEPLIVRENEGRC